MSTIITTSQKGMVSQFSEMEGDTENFLSCKKPLEGSTSHKEVKRPTDNGATTSVFVNHGKPSVLIYRIGCIRRSEKVFCSFDSPLKLNGE